MEQFIKDQIVYGLQYLPVNLIRSFFIPKETQATKALRKKGFVCGVCHPNENYEQIKQANLDWIRIDIPYPFDKDGNQVEGYINFKNRCRGYVENGIKVMAVTPYAPEYIENGADPRTPDGEKKARATARFLIEDLKDLVAGYQITNEMGIPRFTIPLTMDEAVAFIGMHLEEMYPIRGETIIGYNSAGPQADLHSKLRPWHKYCDYVGIDIYLGCFFSAPGFMFLFTALTRYLYALTGKPVLIQEFGYLSGGKPKTKKQKIDILRRYGVNSEKEAKQNIAAFVEKTPAVMRDHVKYVCGNDPAKYFSFIFKSDYVNHLYTELPRITKIPGYEHTPDGQAKFFADIFEKFYNTKHICGAFIYCYSDPPMCYYCGQEDCPTETRWGLVDKNGNPKPSYYAVQEKLAELKNR
ncbi:MAG: hypothetical protein IKJ63_04375 [Clostridia bacterium]|nr:hypothetical protein [Clostridia bacterium]